MTALRKITSAAEANLLDSSESLLVIHFEAEWAPQCQQVNDVLDELSKAVEGAQFYACPAEGLPELSAKYKIDAVPTVILLRDNKVVDRIDGVDIPALTAKVRKHASVQASAPEPLDDRLKKLINRHTVMVFMKGNREAPRCGFSKTLVQILNGVGVEYDTFDILNDEEVRQGLKKYSDWPTYPQVYVKGELIGGLDIVKEMQSNGELDSVLKS